MKEEKKGNTAIPMIIIVVVLALMGVGLWYLYSQSRGKGQANNSAPGVSPTPRATVDPSRAPAGATPPHLLGSPTAMVTVEEFADFQCGACAGANPVLKEIQSIYGSRIRFIFRNFPLQMHDKAFDAAVAAEAAGLQGKFWQMQDQLFTNQAAWSAANANAKQLWTEYAEKIGLDIAKWESDMQGMGARNRVEQDQMRGRALNVGSTPTVLINGQSVPYPEMNVPAMRRIIDAELQKVGSGNQAPAANSGSTAPANTNTAR